jgi:hypothetical protein
MTLAVSWESIRWVLPEFRPGRWPEMGRGWAVSIIRTPGYNHRYQNSSRQATWEGLNHNFIFRSLRTRIREKMSGTEKADKCLNSHTFPSVNRLQNSTRVRTQTQWTTRSPSKALWAGPRTSFKPRSTNKATRNSNKSTKSRPRSPKTNSTNESSWRTTRITTSWR